MTAPRHLVWDWNGTLIDDLPLVISATNTVFASIGGPEVTADQHRREFRRPIVDYYAQVLGRPVGIDEFALLDKLFHDAYQAGLATCRLASGAREALRAWTGTQSLLSMWFHDDLLPTVDGFGLTSHFTRIDGQHPGRVVSHKAPHLAQHLAALQLAGEHVVMVGDTVDDAEAAKSCGAACVLYAGGFTDPEQLRATGVPVVATLTAAVALARTL